MASRSRAVRGFMRAWLGVGVGNRSRRRGWVRVRVSVRVRVRVRVSTGLHARLEGGGEAREGGGAG